MSSTLAHTDLSVESHSMHGVTGKRGVENTNDHVGTTNVETFPQITSSIFEHLGDDSFLSLASTHYQTASNMSLADETVLAAPLIENSHCLDMFDAASGTADYQDLLREHVEEHEGVQAQDEHVQSIPSIFGNPEWAFPSPVPSDDMELDALKDVPLNPPLSPLVPLANDLPEHELDVLDHLADETFSDFNPEDYENDGADDIAHEHRFDLRARDFCFISSIGCTWLDQDESGNYDPNAKLDTMANPLKKKRPAPRILEANADSRPDGPKKPKLTTWMSARQNGHGLDVVLKLHSEAGKELLKKHPSNWPDDHWNVLTGEGVAPRVANTSDAGQDVLDSDNDAPYHLRNRGNIQTSKLNDEDEEDLTGHPVARGCRACHSLRQPCSLLEPGSSRPCEMCAEDEDGPYHCELLVPPKRKQACHACKRRRQACSYTNDDQHNDHSTDDCKQCQEVDSFCIAAPAIDPLRVRIADDGTPAIVSVSASDRFVTASRAPKPRTAANNTGKRTHPNACRYCKDGNKRCTLRRGEESWPCQLCQKQGLFCAVDEAASASITDVLPLPAKGIDSRLFTLRQYAASLRQRLLGHQKTITPFIPSVALPVDVTYISTVLAHPIKFYAAPHMSFKPCHWHLVPTFGLTGLGPPPSVGAAANSAAILPATVAVSAMSSPAYRELAGGHISAGVSNGRMCKECTVQRVAIIICAGHALMPLPPPESSLIPDTVENYREDDPESQAEEAEKAKQAADTKEWQLAFHDLSKTKAGTPEHKRQMRRWCSFCPQLARYSCTTPLETEMLQNLTAIKTIKTAAEEDSGCGLKLCESCTTVFETQDGDLDKTVQELRSMFGMRKGGGGGGGGGAAVAVDGGGRKGEAKQVVKEVTAVVQVEAEVDTEQLEAFWPLGLRGDFEFLECEGFLMKMVMLEFERRVA